MEKEIYTKTVDILKDILAGCPDYVKENTYLVGGCVRDVLLGLTPKDIDLCLDFKDGVSVFMDILQTNHSDICSGFAIFPKYGTAKFSITIGPGHEVDIECVIPRVETYNEGPRKPDSVSQTDIHTDAMRRDFCCNALYKNLWTDDILDPTGHGIDDCKEKVLRTPLPAQDTFKDDPLRMLRAIRFACTKEFTISSEVLDHIVWIPEYDRLSAERCRDEFGKIMMSPKATWAICILISTGLMKKIIPDFQEYQDFDQKSKYHSMTWLEHSLSVLDKVITSWPCCPITLRLAALCHDISKPICYQIKEDGQYSYHGHEQASAERAEEVLRNLRYPEDIVRSVSGMIRNHMCIKSLYNYETKTYTGKPKKTREILRLLGEDASMTMTLIDADNMSHAPEYCLPGQVPGFWEQVKMLKSQNYEPKKIGVSGNLIMIELGIPTGPLVGTIKTILQEYLDNDPGLSDSELLSEYRSEFGDKKFWLASKDIENFQKVFIEKPRKSQYGFWWSDAPGDHGLAIKGRDEIHDFPGIELVELEAIRYPIIWRMLTRDRIVHDMIGNVCKEIGDLSGYTEIKDLQFRYSENDVYVKITWSDGRETEIV